jgi:hypothetical protein
LQDVTNRTGETEMTDINAATAGRIEDKWMEFVADEFAARRRSAARAGRACHARAGECVRQVEVHASYVWLFAGAIVAWLVS